MSAQEPARERIGAPFLVVEGVDGAGTTTLVNKLVSHYREQRRLVHGTCEPTSGPVGSLIRQALSQRFVVQSAFGAKAPAWTTMALLFAADRQDHLEAEIVPLLRDGVTVICDRYDLSSLAYQTATATPESELPPGPGAGPGPGDGRIGSARATRLPGAGATEQVGEAAPAHCREATAATTPATTPATAAIVEWIRTINRYALRPDLTIVVDVRPEVAAQRRRSRGGRVELYDDNELQRRLCEAYSSAETLAPGDAIVHIDGNRPASDVLAEALAAIARLEGV